MSERFIYMGSTLKIEIASVDTLIPGVESASSLLSDEHAMVDVTAIDDDAVQNYSGMPDYGTVEFVLFWDPTNAVHQAILSQKAARNNTVSITGTLNNTGATVLNTVGPIKSARITAGKANEPVKMAVVQKVNDYTLTP
jgi:hypothetical protein